MRRKWMLLIIILGGIGILSDFIHDEFIKFPEDPFSSLRILKYFTIQSNLIVVIYFGLMYFLRLDEKSTVFKNYIVSVSICIFITFAMFLVFLEADYDPSGLGLVASTINHYLTPILTVAFLVTYMKTYQFEYKHIVYWMIYPLLYLVFALIEGQITGEYMYPFIDVNTIGYSGFFITAGGLAILFILLSFLIVKIVSKK